MYEAMLASQENQCIDMVAFDEEMKVITKDLFPSRRKADAGNHGAPEARPGRVRRKAARTRSAAEVGQTGVTQNDRFHPQIFHVSRHLTESGGLLINLPYISDLIDRAISVH